MGIKKSNVSVCSDLQSLMLVYYYLSLFHVYKTVYLLKVSEV